MAKKYKYLFQTQMEEIGDWFAETFKKAELEQKAKYDEKNKVEEYITVVKFGDKELGSGLRIPVGDGWAEWPADLVKEHQASFLAQQKKMIARAVLKDLHGS